MNALVFFRKGIRYIINKYKLSFIEKKHNKRLKYIYEDNGSQELIIVFSGMATRVPKYMYMRTLKNAKIDKLFILDDFGHKGSYYWFENGTDRPLKLTTSLIEQILSNKSYTRLYTAGSSKGGTAAIYYGLLFGATDIIASACQYYVGNYLMDYPSILKGMVGKKNYKSNHYVDSLNNIMPELINKHKNSLSCIHILFSKNDSTFDHHIKYLISDLNNTKIKYLIVEGFYKSHGENGPHISNYLKKIFSII